MEDLEGELGQGMHFLWVGHGFVGRPDTSVDKHPLPQRPSQSSQFAWDSTEQQTATFPGECRVNMAGLEITVLSTWNGALFGLEFLQWVPLLKPLPALLFSHHPHISVLQDHRACADPSSPPAPAVCFELFEPRISSLEMEYQGAGMGVGGRVFVYGGAEWEGVGVGWGDSSVKCLLCQHKR